MIRAVLSIGSNMDDRYALIETVFEEFRDETIAQSPSTPPHLGGCRTKTNSSMRSLSSMWPKLPGSYCVVGNA